MKYATLPTLGTVALGLSACDQTKMETGAPLPGAPSATATLRTGTGADAGRATATEVAGGLRVTLDAVNVPASLHSFRVQTGGRFDAPDFTTAGGHWNPAQRQHGSLNPQGPHEGDMPNMTVGNDGRGTLGVVLPGATIAGLLDADGAAIIIHAAADDLKTDPSGNSGGRIACGVFQAN